MRQLLLLAAQHAGVDDVFTQLVPPWALGALFDRIVFDSNTEQPGLTTTTLQRWLIAQSIRVSQPEIIDFFLKSSSEELMFKRGFVQVLRGKNRLYHSMHRRILGTPRKVLVSRSSRQKAASGMDPVHTALRRLLERDSFLSLLPEPPALPLGTMQTLAAGDTSMGSNRPAGGKGAATRVHQSGVATGTPVLCGSSSPSAGCGRPAAATSREPHTKKGLTRGAAAGGRGVVDAGDAELQPGLKGRLPQPIPPLQDAGTEVIAENGRRNLCKVQMDLLGRRSSVTALARPSMLAIAPEQWGWMVKNCKQRLVPGVPQVHQFAETAAAGGAVGGGTPSGDGAAPMARTMQMNAAVRLVKAKRLRARFEQIDKQHNGYLTLEQFQDFMTGDNSLAVQKVAELFQRLNSARSNHTDSHASGASITFLEMLQVFFPDTNEAERQQLALDAPASVVADRDLFSSLSTVALQRVYDRNLPPGSDSFQSPADDHVRLLLGSFGFGDLREPEGRVDAFSSVDVDGDGVISFKDAVMWYLTESANLSSKPLM